MGTLEVLNMEFSVVLWRRGVPVGVVYAGNNAMFRSEVFPQWTRTGGRTVLIWGGSDDGGVHPVLHLQAVFPVGSTVRGFAFTVLYTHLQNLCMTISQAG